MYVGHYAIGLALKAASPRTPALPLMLGVGFLDIVDGVLVMLGVDRVTPDPAAGPTLFFDLDFIDWDHSLLMAAVLSLAWGALFARRPRVALLAAAASFSHFLADLPLHDGDLALYPHSATHFGWGLWSRLGTLAWALEGVFAAVLAAWAWRASARRGVSLLWPALGMLAMFLIVSPWLSPMKLIATLPAPLADLLLGGVVAGGFLVPGLLMAWLVERAERRATPVRR